MCWSGAVVDEPYVAILANTNERKVGDILVCRVGERWQSRRRSRGTDIDGAECLGSHRSDIDRHGLYGRGVRDRTEAAYLGNNETVRGTGPVIRVRVSRVRCGAVGMNPRPPRRNTPTGYTVTVRGAADDERWDRPGGGRSPISAWHR